MDWKQRQKLLEPLIVIENSLFRSVSVKESIKNYIFPRPLNFVARSQEKWAITGSRKTELLKILAGKGICEPSLGRRYPFLHKEKWPSQVIQIVDFKGSFQAPHLSARYEFFKDQLDVSLKNYLLNAAAGAIGDVPPGTQIETAYIETKVTKMMKALMLDGLGDRWLAGLSNGQMRRTRLAKALLRDPLLFFVDEPFLGLDPGSRETISDVLELLPPQPHVFLGLRIQDQLPSWITHVAIVDDTGITHQGSRDKIEPHLEELRHVEHQRLLKSLQTNPRHETFKNFKKDVIIELDNISVGYRGQTVLKEIAWKVHRGEKWHLRGDNGSGKSTLLSLLTADHPQSWNRKIKLNGEPRQTGKSSYFSVNKQIGHSSPEIHALFPNRLTSRQALATGFVVGSFIPPGKLSAEQNNKIDELLARFEIDPTTKLQDMTLNDQKTVLFLRAIIKDPEILILDEAFSGMDETRVDQCKQLVNEHPGTVIVVGHVENEVPNCDKFIRLLPEGRGYIIDEVQVRVPQ